MYIFIQTKRTKSLSPDMFPWLKSQNRPYTRNAFATGALIGPC